MRVLRRIEGVSRADRVRNEDLRLRLGQVGILELTRSSRSGWTNWRECRMTESQGNFLKEWLKGRDLEVGHREDGLTILSKNLPLGYIINYFCCFHSYMNDLQHWRFVFILVDWLIDWCKCRHYYKGIQKIGQFINYHILHNNLPRFKACMRYNHVQMAGC